MASPIYANAKSTTANGAALLLVAIYVAVVIWNGNIGALWTALKQDIFGKSKAGPAFWQWLICLIILYALAENPSTSKFFEPLLIIALVAMLLQLAMYQPGMFKNLSSGIYKILGGN